jgi:hypothetical protein
VNWQPLAKIVGVVIAGAAWIQFVGGIVVWMRLEAMGVAPTQSLALLPTTYLFIVGIRTLVLPLVLGALAFLALAYLAKAGASTAAAEDSRQADFQLWAERRPDSTSLFFWRRTSTAMPGRARAQPGDTPPLRAACEKVPVLGRRLPPMTKVGNPAGYVPRGLGPILIVMVLVGLLVIWTGALTNPTWQWALTAGLLLVALLSYVVIRRSDGFEVAAVTLFVAVALFGALLGLGVARGADFVKQDIAVVIRTDDTAVGGFYLTRDSDAVYLITATRPGGVGDYVVRGSKPDPRLRVGNGRCSNLEGPVTEVLREPDVRCFVPRLVGIPSDQVKEVLLGPGGVEVRTSGYRTARYLAQVAVTKPDGEHKPGKPTKEAETKEDEADE